MTVRQRVGIDDLHNLVAKTLHPAAVDIPGPGAVGLESEHFIVHVARDGTPQGRATLPEIRDALSADPHLVAEPPDPDLLTGWRAADGSRVLPEPGAQVEIAGVPAASGSQALSRLSTTTGQLALTLDRSGLAMVSAGLDVWHHSEAVSQQLSCPRYPAMHTYLQRRSPHGHTMMTASASLQVNLDLGAQPADRWRTAMLAAPLITSTFACSPTHGAVSGRAVAWQWLDDTRTGIPPALVTGTTDPVAILLDDALRADVLLFRRGGRVHVGQPGFTMGDWLRDGHDEHGAPDQDDLAYHLTTLFPEIRTRGFLEIRGVDALPDRWRAVPVVLLTGLLYDDRTRDHVLDLLSQHTPRMHELLRRAAHLGVADGELCALAVEVWTAAVDGARRLGAGWLDPADIARTERYLNRFTLRGRTPSDELRERLGQSPAAALDWAREPLPSMSHC